MEYYLQPKTTDRGTVIVSNFDDIVEMAHGIVNAEKDIPIECDTDATEARRIRAKFNKCIEETKRVRIDTIEDITSLFAAQCKELEGIFDSAQSELGKRIRAYEDTKKVVYGEETAPKPKKITATVKFYHNEEFEKELVSLCKKHKAELTIK